MSKYTLSDRELGTADDASTIVSALNEVDELREQVRLYELAAERRWAVRRNPRGVGGVEVYLIENWTLTGDSLGSGPTPTAAIAAAEKKEQAK